jgi:anti-sigma factor RsiW
MKVECKDLERVLREQEPAELAALEKHAKECAACAEELEAWNGISVAARSLQRREEAPWLWTQVKARLEEESRAEQVRSARWSLAWMWQGFVAHWQAAAATVGLVALTVTGGWLLSQRTPIVPVAEDAQRRLLTDKALKETESAEAVYVRSIEKLAALAQPKLEKADTPLLANYHEKLLVLDAAIADCRRQAENNKYNAHVRLELTAMYQEKQRTLEAVLREE